MALYRQGSGPYQVGMPPPGNGDHRPGSPFRLHDHVKAEQKGYLGLVRSRSMKAKRLGRSSRSRKCSVGAIALLLLVGVVVTIFGTDYVFPLVRNFKGESSFSALPDVTDKEGWGLSNEDKPAFVSTTTGVKVTARESHEITHRERGISRQTDTGRESGSEAERSSTSGKNKESFRLGHDLDAELDADPKYWDNSDRKKEGPEIHAEVRSEKLEFEETGEKMVGLSEETKSREDRAITLGLDNENGQDTDLLNQYDDTPHDDDMSRSEEDEEELVQQEQLPGKSKKKKKHTTLPCEISFLNSTKGLREPTDSSRFESFSLKYWEMEEKPEDDSLWEPRFAGHQTLLEREDSFVAKDQTLHCGFVKAPEGYRGTGFEISKDDMDYLQTCHIAVSSCIFGNYDHIRNPSGKKVTSASKKKVCFAMFVDQPSLDGMIEEGEAPDENMNLGLWRIVLIKNVPYSDNRRTGKVPKFLTHRLFPNARYSVWLDSKLRLQSDPLLILEYFLWRGHHEYAISNHYDRHCVWEEVEQNKKLNKFNHSVIDQQFAFYQADGLIRFNASDPEKLLPSHVPEGSFIVRAHTPMSNLFSCLWFNEVDRFTPRDQLSFAYTYMKLVRTNPTSHFRLHMFKDCERKAMAKLYRHKTEDALVKGRRH